MHGVQGLSIAGIAIHQERQTRGPRDLANEETDLIHRDNAKIGHSHRGGHCGSGEIQPVKSGGAGL